MAIPGRQDMRSASDACWPVVTCAVDATSTDLCGALGGSAPGSPQSRIDASPPCWLRPTPVRRRSGYLTFSAVKSLRSKSCPSPL